MLVVDACAVIELILSTPIGGRVLARIAKEEKLHVPQLFELEVVSSLRMHESRGSITSADAAHAYSRLLALPLTRYPHEPLINRVWALRGHITPYDAAYVALAERLSAPLVTCDARLAAAPGHAATIELFK